MNPAKIATAIVARGARGIAALLVAAATLVMVDAALAQRPAGAGGQGPVAAAASRPMTLFTVQNAGAKLANCNDGSPAAFYFRPGTAGAEKKWVIFFQGGGGCATDKDCAARWADRRELMTSSMLRPQQVSDGILSTDLKVNPDFANYAHVLIHYCSSDTYAGDTTRMVAGQTFQFRGRRIVDAVLDDLMDKAVVGAVTIKDATEVLVAGSSGGAFGLENNIDRMATRLAPAKVKAIADSNWIPPLDNFGPGTFEVAFYRPQALAYHNAVPDESCAKANPTRVGDCLLSSFVYRYIATPMFVVASLRDPTLLGSLGIEVPVTTAAERAYVQKFSQGVTDGLKSVPAAFVVANPSHTALQNDVWQGVKIGGQTLQQTIGNWYFGRKGAVKLIQTAGQ